MLFTGFVVAHNNAQKLHNDNVRGTGDVPTAVINVQMENAISMVFIYILVFVCKCMFFVSFNILVF
jgi:hypothetical protein